MVDMSNHLDKMIDRWVCMTGCV